MKNHDKEMFRKNILENQTTINKLAEQSLRATLDQIQLITGKGKADYTIWYDGKVTVWIGDNENPDKVFDGIDAAIIHYSRKIRDIYKGVFTMTKLQTIMALQKAQNKLEEAFNALENAYDEMYDVFTSANFSSTFDEYVDEIRNNISDKGDDISEIMDELELLKNSDDYWEDDDKLDSYMNGEEIEDEEEEEE